MKQLCLSSKLGLPLDAITQTFGILGKRGSGKSNAGRVLAEEMHKAGLPFVVIDPVGAWYGLRSSLNGKGPGLSIPIFGGDRGDVPLEREAGQLIADLVAEQRLSCLLDISSFSENDKAKFLTDFAERLFQRNRDPLHLFLEEADDFIPQRVMGERARLVGAWQRIIKRGRSRGLGATMITQRSAAINKDVLTQCETLLVFRTTSPQDMKAVEGWLQYHGQKTDVLASLPSLQDGECWIWSPHWLGKLERHKIRLSETFDSGATPTDLKAHSGGPLGGRRVPATLADVDLKLLSERMAATIEKAKETDPRELRRQIQQLRAELQKAQKQTAPSASDESLKATIEQLRTVYNVAIAKAAQMERIQTKALLRLEKLGNDLSFIASEMRAESAAEIVPQPRVKAVLLAEIRDIPKRHSPRQPAADQRRPQNGGPIQLRAGERRILQALASHYPASYTRSQIGTLTKFAPRGGTFNTYFGVLKRAGYLSENGDGVQIADAGMKYLGSDYPPAPSTTGELLAMWRSALRAGEARMLDELVKVYPNGLSRQELAYHSGFEMHGGTFNTYLGVLRRNGLIEGKDYLKASPTLFLS